MQVNAKESFMVSFQLLHSHLKALSNNDLKGTCIKGGFKQAFVALFDQDLQTFTGSMLLNLKQLEKQLDKKEFQETGSIDSFKALMTLFQTFINFRYDFDDFDDINSMNDKQPLAKVQMFAEHNILANEQHHSEQSESIYDTYLLEKVDRNTTPESTYMSHKGGEIDQNADAKKYTPHYFLKVRESAPAKPHHVTAPSSSRNSKKESYGSNDMAQNYYLEEAKKKTQDKNRNLKPREMPSAKTHHTPNACT
nr:hypothetical protein [Tanacetum cinerariifolium]